jgi:hypothetical protein
MPYLYALIHRALMTEADSHVVPRRNMVNRLSDSADEPFGATHQFADVRFAA